MPPAVQPLESKLHLLGGGAPTAGPPEGPPSSRFIRGPFFVDCILICWGLEFIGELLVVWRSCRSQGGKGEARAVGSGFCSAVGHPPKNFPLPGLAGPGRGRWR